MIPNKDNNRTIVILHQEVAPDATPDEKDTLDEVHAVSSALSSLGYHPVLLAVNLNIKNTVRKLKLLKPLFAFNLVETLSGSGRLVHIVPSILDFLRIPYTGAPTDSIYITTNKFITKRFLSFFNLPTPPYVTGRTEPSFDPPYIVKSQWEHASVGIDNQSVLPSREALKEMLSNRAFDDIFIEQYIEGREFNISILDDGEKPQILPPAEIRFVDFPLDVPHIISYKAKWEMNSFEYIHTQRSFDFSDDDELILRHLMDLSLMCWNLFNLKGYTRVDFRVDSQSRAWILEINTNPCIAPDSGFVAAAEKRGINYESLIKRIIRSVLEKKVGSR